MDTHPPIPRHPLDPLSSAGPGKSATPSELPIPVFKCGILISYKDLLGLAPKKSLLPAISVAVSVICCAICHTIYGSPRLARKLKCDGGRPACGQCTKRSNSCDYMPQTKRRGARQRKGDESESESAEDKSADPDEPSPESSTLGTRNTKPEFQQPLPPLGQMHERRDIGPIPSSSRSKLPMPPAESRPSFFTNELPHIATLSLPDPSPATPAPMSAPSLPPIRPASEQQAAQRRRSATFPGKTGRPQSGSGPKVVACNFCRGTFVISLTY